MISDAFLAIGCLTKGGSNRWLGKQLGYRKKQNSDHGGIGAVEWNIDKK